MGLSNQTCKPPKSGDVPFSKTQAEKMGEEVPDWSLHDTEIAKEFQFKNFLEAMVFVNKVAETAEGQQHHPKILINYNKIRLSITTDKIGGLSQNDFIMAAKIDLLFTKPHSQK
jgi:4a-hydroxytetrahydrobiopterin dehydratase